MAIIMANTSGIIISWPIYRIKKKIAIAHEDLGNLQINRKFNRSIIHEEDFKDKNNLT